MKKLHRYFLSIVAILFAVSCEPAGNTSDVEEGVLKIFADKTEISADGSDCVTFKVMFGSEDVSTKKTMVIVKEYDGKEEKMENGANVFSTTIPGTYKFTARLYSGGDHVSENQVTVTAVKAASGTAYRQMLIGEQFTSLGCQSCPGLSAAIKEVQNQLPDVLIPISFHKDFSGIVDPMSIDATDAFQRYHGFQGLPYFNLNFRKGQNVNTDVSSILSAVREEMSSNPPVCGVAVDTDYDQASKRLNVTAKITSNVASRYKYHIFLVEDGITGYDQMGSNTSYVHDNVVRKMVASAVTGIDINGREPLVPGVEVKASKSVAIEDGWKTGNMRVVVAALISLDGGATWICNNATQCPLGSSADYFEASAPEFEKQVAVWEFTGAWCTNCPSGYSKMNFVISRNDHYKENVHMMAFHSNYSGDDDLALPDNLTDRIMTEQNVQDFPSFLTDMRVGGGLSDATDFTSSLVESFEEYPAGCGVALNTTVADGKINVTARLMAAASSSYRLSVYVVEDRVKYYQKDGTLTHEEYNHRHVVRKVVSSTYLGDRIGDVASGAEVSRTYEIGIDSSWNLEETYIYALAIDSDGHVDNMNLCLAGDKSDYIIK